MKANKFLALLLAAGLCAAPAFAGEFSGAYMACMDTAKNQADEVKCTRTETAIWEKKLEEAYKEALKTYKKLKKPQNAWKDFRDANCEFYASMEGANKEVESTACLMNMTAERADELEALTPEAE